IGITPSARGTSTFHGRNPATSAELEPAYHEATPEEIDAAVKLAESALDPYRSRSAGDRAAFLRAIAAEIEALGEELIGRAVEETALPAARITGERGRTTGQLRMFAGMVEEGSWVDARIDHADAARKPIPKP